MDRRWKGSGSSCVVAVYVAVILLYSQIGILYSRRSWDCNPADLKAMMALAEAMDSREITGWDATNNASSLECCSWVGIQCDSISGRVVEIHLANLGLRGSIPEDISGLEELMVLHLRNNSFRGGIPRGLLSLNRLQTLDLSANNFSGQLQPGSPSYLPSIRTLNISFNRFGGGHPVLLGSSQMVELDAGFNLFTGHINATAICLASPRIQRISLSTNSLSGEFPYGFGGCGSLRDLMLDSNAFSGGFPNDLFRLASLERLFVQENRLNGTLASGIGNLTGLVELDISSNGFSGDIPDVFGRMTRLRILSAASNRFVGTLPASLSSLSAVEVVNLRNNSLGGAIDGVKFSNMPNLNSLQLGSNNFTGRIPGELSSCRQLQTLNLAKNRLSGEIPDGFRNMSSLSFLPLSNNSLSNISRALRTLQHCPDLTALVLTSNFHGERMPVDDGIQGFSLLKLLVVANCGLYGSIPPWLAQCSRLQLLDLSWNRLEGGVPPWISDLDNLFYLDLSNNSLSGELRLSLSRLTGFNFGNSSSQAVPPAVFPFFRKQSNRDNKMQYNQLNSFPPTIDLSTNNLSGTILPDFGIMKRLHVLDLSVNHFSGPIPKELSEITSLECLNLSHNALTGSIPTSFKYLNFLSKFSIAFNSLDGPIPDGGQLSTFPISSFEGNLRLCDGPPPLPPCSIGDATAVERHERSSTLGSEFKLGVLFAFSPAFIAGFVLGLPWSKGTAPKI